jgi:hypothetical protein
MLKQLWVKCLELWPELWSGYVRLCIGLSWALCALQGKIRRRNPETGELTVELMEG